MTIEQMIEKGCTLDDAMDALQELWDEKVKANSKEKEIAAAREKAAQAMYDYYISLGLEHLDVTELNQVLLRQEELIIPSVKKIKEISKKLENSNPESKSINSLDEFLKKMGW